jgi:hypothetical protein
MANEVSRSIEIQACAKIASELTVVTKPETIEDALKGFEEAFSGVLDVVLGRLYGQSVPEGSPWDDAPTVGGRNIPVRKSQDEIKSELDNARSSTAVSAGMKASATPVKKMKDVQIAGQTHGPIPAWLGRAAAKAGVEKVFDNRDSATPENRRPHFVSADGNKTPFWPPKDVSAQDIGLKFG